MCIHPKASNSSYTVGNSHYGVGHQNCGCLTLCLIYSAIADKAVLLCKIETYRHLARRWLGWYYVLLTAPSAAPALLTTPSAAPPRKSSGPTNQHGKLEYRTVDSGQIHSRVDLTTLK